MGGLDPGLPALQSRSPRAFVAFGEAAMDKRYGQLMLTGSGLKANLAQAAVDLLDGRVEQLVDGLVVRFAADIGSMPPGSCAGSARISATSARP
jgi:hypothetical protein